MVQVLSTGGSERLPAATGVVAALLAASCCLLPLALIATGVAGAGLMMTMMRYEWLTLPLGVGGLAGAYALYFRERRRCDTARGAGWWVSERPRSCWAPPQRSSRLPYC